jgi:hypothetical protein
MKRKLLFIIVATFLLFPWTVAYAYDDAAASTGPVTITSVPTNDLPQFNVFGNAISGVTPGDIFVIDSTGTDIDSSFTLSLTNIDELVHNFRYMTLKIGIYILNGNSAWEKAPDSEYPSDIYLTMQNGAVSFTLAGNAKYKITVDKGCFNCYCIGSEKTVALPGFYLTINE